MAIILMKSEKSGTMFYAGMAVVQLPWLNINFFIDIQSRPRNTGSMAGIHIGWDTSSWQGRRTHSYTPSNNLRISSGINKAFLA